MLVTLAIPPFAILAGALLLGERREARAFAGLAVIALGFAALDGRPAALLGARIGRLAGRGRGA